MLPPDEGQPHGAEVRTGIVGEQQTLASDAEVVPQVVMDAGGESGVLLSRAMDRRMGEMAPGQILEIISLEPKARREVSTWCRESGNPLLYTREDGNETWFWIRKS